MKVFISGAAGDARLPRWRDDFFTTLTTFFFIPVQIDNCAAGGSTTIHVPNTGPMTGLLDILPAQVALSVAPAGTKRKYAHTLEWLQLPREVRGVVSGWGGFWAGAWPPDLWRRLSSTTPLIPAPYLSPK